MEQKATKGISPSVANFETLPSTAWLDLAALREITGKSRPTIYRWISKGILPQPIKKPGCRNAWYVGDIRAALGPACRA